MTSGSVPSQRASVVIAAHNEAAVIGACLDSLLSSGVPLDIVVVPNGCTDETAQVAAGYSGVRVIDRHEPGKAAALNAGDQATSVFPRIYLDADIIASAGSVASLCRALESDQIQVAVPTRHLELTGRPPLVRAYFAIQLRLPVFVTGLFGRGMIAVSEAGRGRFGDFPLMVADDLYLDSVFGADERTVVADASVKVETPRRTRDLVRRLVRVRRGNAAMREAGERGEVPGAVRSSNRWSWLRDVVVADPRLAPAGVVYAGITLLAAVLAKRGDALAWGRDESTRVTVGS